ncbi:hypothetical protein LCGC14_2247450 [marine sediment metagenome]|uniref:Uncharacterized protein n=1 Tax=marine sediment metagenome TaxID=412755 RepID=A0A0F9D3B7_9ZZZZ
MTTVAKAKERLGWCGGDDTHVAVAIWNPEDVKERAKALGIKVTDEQVNDILDRLDEKQDCSLGISWDTVDCYLDDYRKA